MIEESDWIMATLKYNWKDFEPEAKALCAFYGQDPNARVSVPCPSNHHPGCCVAHYGEAWTPYARQLYQNWILNRMTEVAVARLKDKDDQR
jgi:hypothetical protein